MYNKENNIAIIRVVLSQVLKLRDYITSTNPEIGPELALILKQVSKTCYRLKRERKTLYRRLYSRAGLEQYLT
jgi:hypothetical protein